MNKISGYDVVVTPDTAVEYPRMQLSSRVCEVLTPAMVADHNAWMREYFGVDIRIENVIADGEAVVTQMDKTVYMNPRTYALLRNEIPIIGGN